MAPSILTNSSSPVQFRTSLHHIRTKCVDRRRLLFHLLWPIPWHFSLPHALSIDELQNLDEVITATRQRNILQLYSMPLFRARDTALRSLYRLYEDIVSRDLIMMGYECEYFFLHSGKRWQLSRIPDPKDDDPMRFAILASLIEALVDAFNWRMERGLRRTRKGAAAAVRSGDSLDDGEDGSLRYDSAWSANGDGGGDSSSSKETRPRYTPERAPLWVERARPLPQLLDLAPSSHRGTSWHFEKRNIKASITYLYTRCLLGFSTPDLLLNFMT